MSACKTVIDVCDANKNLGEINVLCLDNVLALTYAVFVLEAGDVHDNLLTCVVETDEQNVLVTAERTFEHFKQELGVVSAVSKVGVNCASESESKVIAGLVLVVVKAKFHVKVDDVTAVVDCEGCLLELLPSR